MITLYENLRTIVYAPFYLADRRGFWSEEGLIAIRLSPNPVETAEGDGWRADILKPMRDAAPRKIRFISLAFGRVVARDPFILIGRRPNQFRAVSSSINELRLPRSPRHG